MAQTGADRGVLTPADVTYGEIPPCWGLVVVWCETEPERVGQTLLLPPGPGEHEIGRGMGSSVQPMCQNPGINEPAEPLALREVSRTQLQLRVDDAGAISVQNVGRCPMRVDGADASEAKLRERSVIALRDQIAFVCVRRPELIPASRSFLASHARTFGEADQFGVVGESPAAWAMRDSMAFIATEGDHVLVFGEHGSGMLLVSRAIHELSPRAGRPLVVQRAKSMAEGLADADLAGDAAKGGTLVLDRVDELRASLRARFLRTLDRGGAIPGPTDPRVIGTTTRDFAELDADFMARFGLRLWVPPLQKRCEDVPLLARHVLRRLASREPDRVDRFFATGADGRRWPRLDLELVRALVQHRYRAGLLELTELLRATVEGSRRDRLVLTDEVSASLER